MEPVMNTRSKHSAFSAVQQGMGATLGISRTSLWALLISASTFVMLVVFRTELLSLPLQTLCITATGGVFACLILVANLYPTGVWSAPSVYLIMFALFHFGLVTVFGFGVLSEEMRRIVSSWFLSSRTPLAIYPVSYTHLRAHETVLDLVCRLLLEKKKKKKQ